MKKTISMLLLCAALLIMLSSCNVNTVPTPDPTSTEGSVSASYVPTPVPTTTKEPDTDITVTPTSEETPITDETEEFSGRSYVIEKPFDKEENLEVIFSEFCEKYKKLFEKGLDFQLEFRLYGNDLDSNYFVGDLVFVNVWYLEKGYINLRFVPSSVSADGIKHLKLFSYEMFKEALEIENVTKAEIVLEELKWKPKNYSYTVQKPIDEEKDIEGIFKEFCEKYKYFYDQSFNYELEFRVYGKSLTSEEVGNLNFLVYWDEEYGYTRIRFLSRAWGNHSQYNHNVDEFTFEMFKEMVDMKEVTKIEIIICDNVFLPA